MPELGPYGSVRGARGNSRPYRENGWPKLKTARITHIGTRVLSCVSLRLCKSFRSRAEMVNTRFQHSRQRDAIAFG